MLRYPKNSKSHVVYCIMIQSNWLRNILYYPKKLKVEYFNFHFLGIKIIPKNVKSRNSNNTLLEKNIKLHF